MMFTVITCTYNSKKFIENNIRSVSDQNYKNFEHIIIDSFSTDGTLEIIKKYQNLFPKNVKLFQINPNGISNAMNVGVLKSEGDYIIHLHSDDSFFDKNVLSDINNSLSVGNYDWIYGKINVVGESGSTKGIFPQNKIYQHNSDGFFGKQLLKYYNFIPHQSVFIKKKVFENLGFFDESIKSGMDSDLWFRIKDKTRWSFIDRVVSNYCVHPESQSASYKNRQMTILNKKNVRKRYLNKIELVIADFIDWLVEIKNTNYR